MQQFSLAAIQLDSPVIVVTTAGVICSVLFYHIWGAYFRRNTEPNLKLKEGEIIIKLLENEKLRLLNTVPGISTVTYFGGAFDLGSLQSRVREVIRLNPFLVGRLVSSDRGEVCLLASEKYLTDEQLCDVKVQSMRCPELALDGNINYSTLQRIINDHNCQVKVGKFCVNNKEALFKVVVFVTKPGEEFAMVVSMSHVLGDGNTYYEILSMLDPQNPVKALDPIRKFDKETEVPNVIHDSLDISNKGYFWAGTLLGLFYNKFIRPPMHPHLYYLDADQVEKIKAEYAAGCEENSQIKYISTNDIVMSWFARFIGANVVSMVLNYRGRVAGLGSGDAGNYIRNMIFRQVDVNEPWQLRELFATQPFRPASKSFPTYWERASMKVMGATNWSTFCREISICGSCKQLLQLPLMELGQLGALGSMTIFKGKEGSLAVMLWCRGFTEADFQREAIIGKKIMHGI